MSPTANPLSPLLVADRVTGDRSFNNGDRVKKTKRMGLPGKPSDEQDYREYLDTQ